MSNEYIQTVIEITNKRDAIIADLDKCTDEAKRVELTTALQENDRLAASTMDDYVKDYKKRRLTRLAKFKAFFDHIEIRTDALAAGVAVNDKEMITNEARKIIDHLRNLLRHRRELDWMLESSGPQ